MTVLNTAVAQQLIQFKRDVDALIEKNVKKDEAIFQVIRKYIIDSKNVRFEGNSYSEDWHKEAKKRGLTNVTNVIEALDAYLTTKARRLFKVQRVLNEKELEGRTDVRFDNYSKRIQIESRVIGDIALNQIVPSAIIYQTSLIESVKGLKEIFGQNEFRTLAGARIELIKTISEHITTIKAKVHDMTEARKVANKLTEAREKATQYAATVLPYIEEIRYHIDKLEEILDNELWPLPKYRELLFSR
jgi:glutamine synthetase